MDHVAMMSIWLRFTFDKDIASNKTSSGCIKSKAIQISTYHAFKKTVSCEFQDKIWKEPIHDRLAPKSNSFQNFYSIYNARSIYMTLNNCLQTWGFMNLRIEEALGDKRLEMESWLRTKYEYYSDLCF